jgi:CubicO group peptidase (beta-lactamase class C family)
MNSSQPHAVNSPDPRIDRFFSQWDKPDSPGCSLAVAQAGTIVYSRGYGTADLDHGIPNTPATVFHAASLSKQFTAMSIMLLVNRGLLELGDYVSDIIPELPNFGGKPITISDILHHISGIRDQGALVTMAGWRLSDDVVTQDDVLDLVQRMKDLNFNAGAGTDFAYSNTNYTLASLIIQRKSEMSLPDFARKYIFVPLDMTSTTILSSHGQIVENRAYGYRFIYPDFQIRMPNYDLNGPTNLQTTVEDLIKWDRNFDSKVVGGDAALTAMQTPVAHSGIYGLGLYVHRVGGRLVIEHDGRDAGYRSHLSRWPDEKLTVALLCNIALPDTIPTTTLVRDVAAVFLDGTNPPGAAVSADVQASPAAVASPADFVGRYFSGEIDSTYEIELSSSLMLKRKKYKPAQLKGLAGDRFSIDDFSQGVSSALTAVTLHFSKDAQGKVLGFTLDDTSGAKRICNFKFTKLP